MTIDAISKNDDDDFIVVQKSGIKTGRKCVVTDADDEVKILPSLTRIAKYQKNFFHVLADDVDDDEEDDAETQICAVATSNSSNIKKKIKMDPSVVQSVKKTLKYDDILKDSSAMELIFKNDNKAVECKHAIEARKEISPKTVQFLEPLFKYFQKVCESTVPFPGFRLGSGGSMIRHAPFLSKRLSLRNKQAKKMEIQASVNVNDESSCNTVTMPAPSLAGSNNKNKKFYRYAACFLLSCMATQHGAMAHSTNEKNKIRLVTKNNKSAQHRRVNSHVVVDRRPYRELEDDEADDWRVRSWGDEEEYMEDGKVNRNLKMKPNRADDANKKPRTTKAMKATPKPNMSPARSAKPTTSPTAQPSTTRALIHECNNGARVIPDYVSGSGSFPDYALTVSDKITVSSDLLVSAVEVFVNISHTWRGDLTIKLVHGDTTVVLKLDDSDYRHDIYGTYPTTLTPLESLSAFEGSLSGGSWTLQIGDGYPGDFGTLNQWCLGLRGVDFGNTLTDFNIQYAAHKWVTNNVNALAQFGDISTWDISKVTNMDNVFGGWNPYATSVDWAMSFNGDVSQWDTSQVTSMVNTFYNAVVFNGDLSQWKTSKVTDMTGLFANAQSFNGDISKWDISEAQYLDNMFTYALSFDGDLSMWDTHSVNSMSHTFIHARSFHGNDLSKWNTSQVTSMRGMFRAAQSFNGDISTWDVSQVTRMDYMFSYALKFNSDISEWDTSKNERLSSMFSAADSFNGDVSKWNTGSVWTMRATFAASVFNSDISKWDTSRVYDMSVMFYGTSRFNGNLSTWNTGQVINMYDVFGETTAFNGDVSLWNTSSVESMDFTFFRAASFNGDLSKWDTRRVTSMYRTFCNATKFNSDLAKWNTSQVVLMPGLFFNASSFNQTLCWDISKVTNDTDYYGFPGLSIFDGSLGSFAAKPYPACLAKPSMKPVVKKTKKA